MHTEKLFPRLLSLCLIFVTALLGSMAQSTQPLIAEFRTSAYDTDGESNSIQMTIGGIAESEYIDVDCGFGTEEHEVVPATYDTENEEWTGTTITLNVSAEGMVRIYGNAENIQVIDIKRVFPIVEHPAKLFPLRPRLKTGFKSMTFGFSIIRLLDKRP